MVPFAPATIYQIFLLSVESSVLRDGPEKRLRVEAQPKSRAQHAVHTRRLDTPIELPAEAVVYIMCNWYSIVCNWYSYFALSSQP